MVLGDELVELLLGVPGESSEARRTASFLDSFSGMLMRVPSGRKNCLISTFTGAEPSSQIIQKAERASSRKLRSLTKASKMSLSVVRLSL